MKQEKRNYWVGIILIIAAAILLFGKRLPFIHISIWTLALTLLLVAVLIRSLIKLEWVGLFFSLAFLAILYDDFLGITDLTPWTVLAAALLLAIGFNVLFRKTKRIETSQGNDSTSGNSSSYSGSSQDYYKNRASVDNEYTQDEYYRCSSSFSSTVKYVKCVNFKNADIESSFANSTVYFDSVRIGTERATINVKNNFGKTILFIPRDWHADIVSNQSFGHVDCIGECAATSSSNVEIKVETSFGVVEIHFV